MFYSFTSSVELMASEIAGEFCRTLVLHRRIAASPHLRIFASPQRFDRACEEMKQNYYRVIWIVQNQYIVSLQRTDNLFWFLQLV
jgi:hypothetical protein